MKRQYIAKQWNSFAREVLSKNAPPVQRIEMRRAFYAGAVSLFHTMNSQIGSGPTTTEEDLNVMKDINQEFIDYAKSLEAETHGR